MISLYVATSENGVIGKKNALPWYLPADLERFKQITMGHPIIMGRKTHESIGRALPGRTNIVISRNKNYRAKDCIVVGSLDEALETAQKSEGNDEIFIIGGSSVFDEALALAGRIHLTRVKARVDGDIFFKFDPTGWHQTFSEKHQKDEKNQFDYEFVTLERLQ
jgi:dihydrofolate reductase